MIRIYSEKAFALGEGVTPNNPDAVSFVTKPGTFQEISDYLQNDPMFKLAVKDGSIKIVGKFDESNVNGNAAVDGLTPESAAKQFAAEIKTKTLDEVVKIAEEYGVKLSGNESAKEVKKLIMKAYSAYSADSDSSEDSKD